MPNRLFLFAFSAVSIGVLAGCNTTGSEGGLNFVGGAVGSQVASATPGGSFVGTMFSNAGSIVSELNQSDENQKAQGQQGLQGLRQKNGLLEGHPLAQHLTKIARKLGATKAAGQHPYQFEVYLTRETVMNAYTFGGGIIFVSQGLVTNLENEAQMASVIGHEMGHILKSHAAQKRATNMLTRIGLTAAEKLSPSGLGGMSDAAKTGTYVALTTTINSYSRAQETESDRIGLDLIVEAGYDPREMVKVFEIFEQKNGAKSELTNFFTGSHPTDGQRISDLRAEIQARKDKLKSRRFIADSREYKAYAKGFRQMASR